MHSALIVKSDYLKQYEPNLKNKTVTFFDKCNNFKSEVDCLRKVIKKYYVEENVDKSEDPMPVFEDSNKFIRSEYDRQLQKFDVLGKTKNLLQCLLLHAKLEDDNDECVDMELFGLPFKEQKLVLLKRIDNLKHCKELDKKMLRKLQEELSSYQLKEQEMTFAAISITDFYKTKLMPVKILERDINNEVTRIKEVFTEKYEKLFLVKLKCEKLDVRMRHNYIPKITTLETSLMEKRFELEKVQNDTRETVQQQNLKNKIDDEYEKKLRGLTKDYDKVVLENKNTASAIEHMKKSFVRTFKKKDKLTKIFAENLINSAQNSAIDKRISDIQSNQLKCALCYTTNSTACEYTRQDVTIINLREQICRMIRKINNSTNFINVLKNDLEFLRNEHQKYGKGHDYMGNTIMAPKSQFNI